MSYQEELDKLVEVLSQQNADTSWKPSLKSFLAKVLSEVEASQLSPEVTFSYMARRIRLWDDFRSGVVLQPVILKGSETVGLTCVWTHWGSERPTLPGGRVNGPDELPDESGHLRTSRVQAAQELFEEVGLEVDSSQLVSLAAVDVRVKDSRSGLINNHQLEFYLAPAISQDTFSITTRNLFQQKIAHDEIAKAEVLTSYREFERAVREWEQGTGRIYPFDRIARAVKLFFERDLDDQMGQCRFRECLNRFNNDMNSKVGGLPK